MTRAQIDGAGRAEFVAPAGPAPVGASERIEIIDVIRGFALFGVLLANLVWLSQFVAVTEAQRAALPTAELDRIAVDAVRFFVDWKFYTLFSFLFGLGFAVQLTRAEEHGSVVVPLYLRRLGVLLCIGIAHHWLAWYGDILHQYALLGLVLILFRRVGDRTLLGLGLGFGVLLPAVLEMGRALLGPEGTGPPPHRAPAAMAARFEAFTQGGYLDVLRENALYGNTFWTTGFAAFFLTAVFGKFLLGYYVGRGRFLHEPERHLPLFRRLLWWGFAVGFIGNAIWVAVEHLTDTGRLSERSIWAVAAQLPIYSGILAMAAFYLSAIVLLSTRDRWRRRLVRLAPVGRMALTNYLSHTAVYLFVFYGMGPGLGLMGQVGAAFCVLLSLVVFAGQMALSAWWLERFRYGPMEWVWRSLTYGSPQPMRIRPRAPGLALGG